jgi:hypothetical protein
MWVGQRREAESNMMAALEEVQSVITANAKSSDSVMSHANLDGPPRLSESLPRRTWRHPVVRGSAAA